MTESSRNRILAAESKSSGPSPQASLSVAPRSSVAPSFMGSIAVCLIFICLVSAVVGVVVSQLVSKTCAPVAQATLRHSPKRQHKNKRDWHKWKALGFLCKQANSSIIQIIILLFHSGIRSHGRFLCSSLMPTHSHLTTIHLFHTPTQHQLILRHGKLPPAHPQRPQPVFYHSREKRRKPMLDEVSSALGPSLTMDVGYT